AEDRLAAIAGPVLRGAAKGLLCEHGGFDAAELWLLDEATRKVQLAARWARTNGQPAAEPRALADAPADVAALAGGAVVLEDADDAAGWGLHTPNTGAAICLPVASDTTVHGVLWLVRETPLAICDEAVELAEIIAGRLALEVERTATVRERPTTTAEAVRPEPKALAPTPTPPDYRFPPAATVEPVEAAAWTAAHAEGVAAAGCWEIADDRLLALSVAAIDSPESSTASQRAAVEWLMDEARLVADRAGDAGLLLTLLNRRLLDSPLAGEGLAVAAAIVDTPEDADAGIGGIGTYATAGPTVALSVRAAMTDTHAGDLVPLGWSEPEAAYAPRPFELAIRQRLVLAAGDPRLTSPLVERRLGDVYRAATADAHREMTAEGSLRRLMTSGTDDVLAAVALRRA
ncbi:MAG: GAF domain-containing protein, partial [Planctomycetota bacterium]